MRKHNEFEPPRGETLESIQRRAKKLKGHQYLVNEKIVEIDSHRTGTDTRKTVVLLKDVEAIEVSADAAQIRDKDYQERQRLISGIEIYEEGNVSFLSGLFPVLKKNNIERVNPVYGIEFEVRSGFFEESLIGKVFADPDKIKETDSLESSVFQVTQADAAKINNTLGMIDKRRDRI